MNDISEYSLSTLRLSVLNPFVRLGLPVLIFTLLLFFSSPGNTQAQEGPSVDVGGYLEALPIYLESRLPGQTDISGFWEQRIQNRLSFQWYLSSEVSFTGELRTRLFAGELTREIPGYADLINSDSGIINLSRLIVDRESWFVHTIPDRLYGEWANSDWSVRLGRQRVNWGINMMSNPNDLFNIYSFYDFAYPERPGADAIRIQRFFGFASRAEVAFSPARDMGNSVGAFLYSFNRHGYDLQLLGGYYRNKIVIGGGWAGSIRQTGFKGELSWFFDLKNWATERNSSLVFALSADHMFENRLFLVVEALYNQAGGRDRFSFIGSQLSADNPSFSKFQMSANATYPVSLLLNASLAVVGYPGESAIFISPQLSLSLSNNLDLQIISQFFAGSSESPFADSGLVIASSLKWNF